ncbi:unnamed protein product [Cuscuta epithymum]|uniref:DUF4283 domain-containing protein n=1 Tax=Cuscuta epithymum TaxID=186058 RepID=A0AAV0ERG4_9ASTE|nr:unnamed protein product [Cuscuta epithymum]
MEDVLHQYKQMAIGDDKEEVFFDEEEEGDESSKGKAEFPVIGIILTDRKIKSQYFKELMASLWTPVKGVSIQEISDKRYIFTFYHKLDMRRVLDEGPWLFERNLLLLKEIQTEDIPLQINLYEADFLVQVHNAAYGFMNLGSARRIGNYIGTFLSFDDKKADEKFKPFLRIRVRMDVRRPLKKGTTLK